MTDAEKITMVKTLVENDAEATDSVVATYLSVALNKMLVRLYPFADKNYLPKQYDTTQCELAARLFLRKGGEGEISHNENGVSRSYGTVDDEDILSRLTPYACVPKTYPTLTYALTYNGQPAVPDIAGRYRLGTLLSFESDANIYYTTDGSTPDVNSTLYFHPIPLAAGINQVFKAVAWDGNYGNMLTLTLDVNPY